MQLENKNACDLRSRRRRRRRGRPCLCACGREGLPDRGPQLDSVEEVAKSIVADGAVAEAAQVDVLDEEEVEKHATAMLQKAGSIDISFNATGIPQPGIQGIPLAQLSAESFDSDRVLHAFAF